MRIRTLLLFCGSPLLSLCAGEIPLTDLTRFDSLNAITEISTYHGRRALHVTELKTGEGAPGEAHLILKNQSFHNGTIDLEVSGAPSKTADPTARGFIGIVFRLTADGSHSEIMYVRPSNARAEDQLARNHTLQYASTPDWGWRALREKFPAQYESYADMQAGEWVHMRVVVHGKEARLFVGKAEQPGLIVKEMKLGDSEGRVALWVGPGTDGYFRDFRITALE